MTTLALGVWGALRGLGLSWFLVCGYNNFEDSLNSTQGLGHFILSPCPNLKRPGIGFEPVISCLDLL